MSGKSSVFVSYSANHEDVLLNRIFEKRTSGFYIDVGAAHPMYENDTKALYDRGWSGINIEPNITFYEVLAIERPRDNNLNIAISDTTGLLIFFEVKNTGLSTCDPDEAARARDKGFEIFERQVQTETLRDLLENIRPPRIDLLKIDVEGFEPNVIRSNDWNRYRPNVILVEATFPETPIRRPDVVGPLLERVGYHRVYFDGLNDYYLENDFVAPEGAFDTPPNIFDRFMPRAHAQLSQERDFLQEETTNLKRERADALKEISSLRKALNQRLYLEEDLVRARGELLTLRTGITTLADQIASLEAERVAKEVQLATAEARINAIWQSTSWRVTRPLRAIAHPRRTLRILTGKHVD